MNALVSRFLRSCPGPVSHVLGILLLSLWTASALLAQAPPGYYGSVDATSAAALRQTLHEVIDDHIRFPYTDANTDTWDILELADEDPNDPGSILDLYKNASYAKQGGGNTLYNREHTWAKSYGFPIDEPNNYPYTDCHHLFLSDIAYNSDRSNKPFRFCNSGCTEDPTLFNDGRGGGVGVYPGNSNWTSGSFTQGAWETWSGRKGDVARAILYMDIRYEGGVHGVTGVAEPDLIATDSEALIDSSNTGSNESVGYMGVLSVLLQWHAQDPPDSREMHRNDAVFSFQGNRNPFIDHPEWVDCLYRNLCGSSDTTPPAAPTGLSATPGDGFVSLAWSPNGEPDLGGYHVYRATTSGGPYTRLNPVLLTAASFADTAVVNGTTYFYVATAVDTSANESTAGNEAAATPRAGSGGGLILSEVLYDVSGTDDGLEWVELFNAGPTAVDLSGWSLGNGGIAYTDSTVQLSGVIGPGQTFVVGGPTSAAINGNPVFDQVIDFSPDFQNSGTAADGVALFDVPAAQITTSTVPVDAVLYGPTNSTGLIDETGAANPPEVGDASPGTSLERVDLAGNWILQSVPTPNATPLGGGPVNTAPVVTITAPTSGSVFTEGAAITFAGSASDAEDGDLTAALSWSSDLDGPIGSGGGFSAVLSVGTHTVTAAVTDAGGLQGFAAITVHVDPLPQSGGTLLLSEVFYDPSGTDDQLEWVEIYNNDTVAIDLAGFSLGAGGLDYTTTLVQLSGVLQPGETFVVGGPISSAVNWSPVLGLAVDFNPDLQNSGTAGDGVALFNVPAAQVTASTVPIDAVVYGPNNSNGLIDETGFVNPPEVGDAPSDASIERLDAAGSWQIQLTPTPNTTPLSGGPVNTAPVATITAPADGSTFVETDVLSFTGTAADTEDGDLTDFLTWTSDLDGVIGSGGAFTATLSVGTHTLTASVTDSGALTSTDLVHVTVQAAGGTPVTVTLMSNGTDDGWVRESSETSNQGGTASSNGGGGAALRLGDDRRDRQYKLVVSFDTSALPAGAALQSVTLRLRRGQVTGSNPFLDHGAARVDIASGAFGIGPALDPSDFEAPATAASVGLLGNPAANGDWAEASLDTAGRAAVNPAGTTQLRIAFDLDDDDDRGNDYMGFFSGSDGDPANHPQLVVTYLP